MQVNVIGGEISESEKQAYLERAQLMFPDRRLVKLDIYLDGDFVELGYYFAEVPFERIRRITGYLVGDVGRWNDAKRAELADRVAHSVYDNSGQKGAHDNLGGDEFDSCKEQLYASDGGVNFWTGL